ncbi:hypothetical protein THAOC_18970 [Thalassiosira oceanica]|uniref:Transmembrane protein n=1 Tax=Thalassiosira oceanica TaxID=159749 RepID=K0S5V9_THAOC|nr:hypothetical protein THAOC_18970 [Thalassiosira oceanica]|eukprot:EJK60635.1 hypothetical protein THAOC_18970 [Thalassiosira oceanica]
MRNRWMLCAALAAVAACSFVSFGVPVVTQQSHVLEHVAPQMPPVVGSRHAFRHLVGDEWEDDDDGHAFLVDENSTDVDGGPAVPTNADMTEPEETVETDTSKVATEDVLETEEASVNDEGNDEGNDEVAGGGLEMEVAEASDEDVDAAELEAEIETLNEEETKATDDDYVDGDPADGLNDVETQSKHKVDGVVIISEDIGEKESELNPDRPSDQPPPPPPLPPGSDEKGSDDVARAKSATSSKTLDGGHDSKSEDGETDDTIFDDLLRGFIFATFFSVLAICVYRACYFACVKCGVVPDERVVAARLRRLKLKNKRSFNRNIPPLDTRLWGEWMKQREGVGNPDEYFSGGVWDSSMDDIERGKENDAWDDDDSESSIGIEFENVNSIEMSKYHGVSSSDHVLEFGEGEELEDRSHDDRLFDNDGGQQLNRHASDFFNEHSRGGKPDKGRDKNTTTPSAFWDTPVEDKTESTAKDNSEPTKGDERQHVNAPDDDFFDALATAEPPSANVDDQEPETPSREESMSMSLIADENQGYAYDEETDLLGLRSDSPPPLDLELIEKQMVENMENAKLF